MRLKESSPHPLTAFLLACSKVKRAMETKCSETFIDFEIA